MRNRIFGYLILLALALPCNSMIARAAELLMFEEPGCVWCQRWHAEIGPSYPLTIEGQLAPLRRVDIREQRGVFASLQRPVTVTPTFVLVDRGLEIGRIVGYPGSDFFYPFLADLLKRLPVNPSGPSFQPDLADALSSRKCTL